MAEDAVVTTGDFALYDPVDGKVFVIDSTAETTPCCKPCPTCADLTFNVFAEINELPDCEPCPACSTCEITSPTQGATKWSVGWQTLDAFTGCTYKLWRKASGECADCSALPVDLSGYDLYATYTEPPGDTPIEIDRVVPVTSCDQNNYVCWALEVLRDDERVLVCCAVTPKDFTDCIDCKPQISLTGFCDQCTTCDETPGLKRVNGLWDLSGLTDGCDTLLWNKNFSIVIDGVTVSTGNTNGPLGDHKGGFDAELNCSTNMGSLCAGGVTPCRTTADIVFTITDPDSGAILCTKGIRVANCNPCFSPPCPLP